MAYNDRETMKILITNDDGIAAPGLAALEQVALELGSVHVVAPSGPLSGCGHRVSTDAPLRAETLAENRHALHGTPADCTRVGLVHLAPDVDWVFSGINCGGNLGVDVFMSGTVAAAREAAWMGRPAIAFSQFRRNRAAIEWTASAGLALRVAQELMSQQLQPGEYWNVNFPDNEDISPSPQIVFCNLEEHALPVNFERIDGHYHYRGAYADRKRTPGSDVDICFSGNIAVTKIRPHHR